MTDAILLAQNTLCINGLTAIEPKQASGDTSVIVRFTGERMRAVVLCNNCHLLKMGSIGCEQSPNQYCASP